MNTPLRFVPYLRPMVWGGRRLADVLRKPLPSADAYGESWEVSDHALHQSRVAAGPLAGRSLRTLMEQERAALLGREGPATFPWLVKFLDACDWLSVQVHPDDARVGRLWPGEGGKTEAWLVLDAAPGSRIYAGLLPGAGEAELRALLRAGTVVECLHAFEPRPGDCVFLPAGTVHAVGGGVLMAEVQQTSDATFRLFDWNRRDAQGKARTLHVEESLACIDWSRGPVEPIRVDAFGASRPAAGLQPLVRCPYFALEHGLWVEPFALGGDGLLRVMVVLKGGGLWDTHAGPEELSAGQVWLLPGSMPRTWCRPEAPLSALVSTLP